MQTKSIRIPAPPRVYQRDAEEYEVAKCKKSMLEKVNTRRAAFKSWLAKYHPEAVTK